MKVTELRIGMTIVESNHTRTLVRSLTPCTQPRKVHVNDRDCYDYCAYVTVA
jgi:hypothetical protein